MDVQFLKTGQAFILKRKTKVNLLPLLRLQDSLLQEHAKSVLNNPNATPLQKKRANFARNAAKWKHEDGAKIHKPSGHRSILDNGWIPTTRLKKGNYGLIKTRKQ